MNAVRKDEYPEFRPNKRRKPRVKTNSHRGMIAETSVKLGVNILLSSVAIASLWQLLPEHKVQKIKLTEVNQEVDKTEARVNELRDKFSRNFAPGEVNKVIQEQSNVISPSQLRVVIAPKTNLENQTQISQNKR
jgi:hypothetical protein